MEKERAIAVVVLLCLVVVVELPEASATRFMVGGKMGWNSNVNYTIWAQDKHFYNGDWLFFVYDRNQMDVLEVNQTNYVSCNAEHPVHNWTTGAGRDVVPLKVTRHYYFISSKGFCYGGMKIAVKVENMPPPPKASPVKSKSSVLTPTFRSQFVLPVVFAIGAMWDTLVRL
ncbi:early nodulin-like protein 17 [Pyrus communis]|uniref:early nodulin-like protein 17 n=1 Tax=Pyrus communis TaxID=23211 RepID=UPI0035C0BE56